MKILMPLFILLFGCSAETDFQTAKSGNITVADGAEEGETSDNDAKPRADDGGKKEEDPKEELIKWRMSITTSDRVKTRDQDLNIVAVVDSSPSMTASIASLRQSVSRLFSELDESKMPFSIRILRMDHFEKMLEAAPGIATAVAPKGLFGADEPNYGTRGTLGALYKDIQSITSDESAAKVSAILSQIESQPAMINNEFGIAAAYDYLAFVEKNTVDTGLNKFVTAENPTAKVHFIVISDEDNSSKQETRSELNGSLISEKDTIIHRKVTATGSPTCTSQVENQWTQYKYTYKRKDLVNQDMRLSYNYVGLCDQQGYVNANTPAQMNYRLGVLTGCGMPFKTCYNNPAGVSFSCSTTGNTVASGPNISTTQKRCEYLASGVECEKMRDGKMFWFDMSRDEAIAYIAQGGNCRAKDSAVWAVKNDTPMSWTAAANLIRSCTNYTCTDLLAEKAYANVLKTQWGSYARCDAANAGYSSVGATYSPTVAANKITGFNQTLASCPVNYEPVTYTTPSVKLSNTYYCGTNINEKLPLAMGTIGTMSGVSDPTVLNRDSGVRRWPKTYTNAQIAAALGVRESDLKLETLVKTDVWNDVTEIYTYAKYGANDPIRTDPNVMNFAEVPPTEEKGANPPPPANQNATSMVRQVTIYKENGVVVPSCELLVKTEKHYFANPTDFKAAVNEEFPNIAVTWHSIIRTSNDLCPNEPANSVAAKGEQYLELSAKTGGLTANICGNAEGNYDNFVKALAYFVVNEVDELYDLPAEYVGKEVVKIINGADKEFKVDVDFVIVDGKRVKFLDKNAIAAGDEMNVFIKK